MTSQTSVCQACGRDGKCTCPPNPPYNYAIINDPRMQPYYMASNDLGRHSSSSPPSSNGSTSSNTSSMGCNSSLSTFSVSPENNNNINNNNNHHNINKMVPLSVITPPDTTTPYQNGSPMIPQSSATPRNRGQKCKKSSTAAAPAANNKNGPKKDPPVKKFNCDVCLKKFGYKHVLTNHYRKHTNERPYKCLECSKRFTRDHHLKTHMRLHTGERPYKCSICKKEFVQVANLKRHELTHTGAKPHTCKWPGCEQKFSSTSQLKTHIKKSHQQAVVEGDGAPNSVTTYSSSHSSTGQLSPSSSMGSPPITSSPYHSPTFNKLNQISPPVVRSPFHSPPFNNINQITSPVVRSPFHSPPFNNISHISSPTVGSPSLSSENQSVCSNSPTHQHRVNGPSFIAEPPYLHEPVLRRCHLPIMEKPKIVSLKTPYERAPLRKRLSNTILSPPRCCSPTITIHHHPMGNSPPESAMVLGRYQSLPPYNPPSHYNFPSSAINENHKCSQPLHVSPRHDQENEEHHSGSASSSPVLRSYSPRYVNVKPVAPTEISCAIKLHNLPPEIFHPAMLEKAISHGYSHYFDVAPTIPVPLEYQHHPLSPNIANTTVVHVSPPPPMATPWQKPVVIPAARTTLYQRPLYTSPPQNKYAEQEVPEDLSVRAVPDEPQDLTVPKKRNKENC